VVLQTEMPSKLALEFQTKSLNSART
jgi:hypothetical protein